jgi:uncharacterized membrane protein YgcG
VAALAAATLLVAAALVARPIAQVVVPERAGAITDIFDLLDAETERQLNALIGDVQRETGTEMTVATVLTLEGLSVERFGAAMFDEWGLGRRTGGNAVLILVAKNQREAHIESGDGLATILPQGMAADIVRDELVPYFRDERYRDGIVHGVERIAAIVRARRQLSPEELERYDNRLPRWVFYGIATFFAGVAVLGGLVIGVSIRNKVVRTLLNGIVAVALTTGILSMFGRVWLIAAPLAATAAAVVGHRRNLKLLNERRRSTAPGRWDWSSPRRRNSD